MLNDDVELTRRVMVLFLLVDTSGSMDGAKINTVNDAIANVIPVVRNISAGNADSLIKIAAMKFDNSVEWITQKPEEAETFVWHTLPANGMTHMGEACRQLDKKLSTKGEGFMRQATGSFAPVIFMMSDGQPNDDFDGGLKVLKENKWFKAAIKVAIAIGDDADHAPLIQFVGSKEGVITVHDPDNLRKWINFLIVTSSTVGSKSSNTKSDADGTPAADNTKQEEMLKAMAGQAQATGAVQAADGTIDTQVAATGDVW